jgi:RNA polymerase sigma-70 factor (ECF subfamily)
MAHGQDSMLDLPRDFPAVVPCTGGHDFEAFSREQHAPLLNFLRQRTGEEDARDIAQESLSRLLRYRHTEPAEAWRPLLYRIARNLLNEQYRRYQSHGEHYNVPVETIELPDPAPPPDLAIQQAQQQTWLREAMQSLPPRCRQVFVLVRIDGLSQGEVARRCGISLKTVEKHLAKALAALCDKAGIRDSGASP